MREIAAATTIQRAYRGHLARKYLDFLKYLRHLFVGFSCVFHMLLLFAAARPPAFSACSAGTAIASFAHSSASRRRKTSSWHITATWRRRSRKCTFFSVPLVSGAVEQLCSCVGGASSTLCGSVLCCVWNRFRGHLNRKFKENFYARKAFVNQVSTRAGALSPLANITRIPGSTCRGLPRQRHSDCRATVILCLAATGAREPLLVMSHVLCGCCVAWQTSCASR